MRAGDGAVSFDICADVDFRNGDAHAFILSATNGLVRRSCPNVEVGPWPGTNVTSSPSGQSLSRTDHTSSEGSPGGKSVRPIDPANSTSPTKASRFARLKKITWPGVCPG